MCVSRNPVNRDNENRQGERTMTPITNRLQTFYVPVLHAPAGTFIPARVVFLAPVQEPADDPDPLATIRVKRSNAVQVAA